MTLSARVDVTTLRKAVTVARKATGRRVTLPALAAVRLDVVDDQLELYATDLEQTITVKAPAWDASGGPVAVMGHDLTRLLRGVPKGPATLTVTDQAAELEAGRVRGAVRVMPVEDMPTDEPCTGDPTTLNPDQMAMLARVAQAASPDEARPVLTAVQIDGTRANATDSYRLYRGVVHHRRLADGALVPARAIRMVAQVARGRDVTFRTDEARSGFAWSRDDLDVDLTVRHIEGHYPDTAKLIGHAVDDEAATEVEIDRAVLLDVARRHAAYIGSWMAHAPVLLRPSDGGMEVRTGSDGSELVETVDVPWPSTAAFNPEFLVDILTAAAADTVTVRFRNGLKPLLVHGDGIDLLLMPMRTGSERVEERQAA